MSLPPGAYLSRQAVPFGREAELRTVLGDADEAGVVAADADRDQGRVRAQGVELRRVGPPQPGARLGFGHVLGLGAAAAHVDEVSGLNSAAISEG